MKKDDNQQLVANSNNSSKISFNGINMDLFMPLVISVMDKDNTDIIMDINDLLGQSQYQNVSPDRVVKYLITDFKDKISEMTVNIKCDTDYRSFVIFNHYRVDANKNTLMLSVSEDVVNLFANIIKNNINFDYLTYTVIAGKYSVMDNFNQKELFDTLISGIPLDKG